MTGVLGRVMLAVYTREGVTKALIDWHTVYLCAWFVVGKTKPRQMRSHRDRKISRQEPLANRSID